MRIEGVVLKYHAHAPVLRGKICDVLFAEKDSAVSWFFKSADHVQGGAFAATGRAKKSDQLSVWNFKIEIVHCSNRFPGFPPAGRKLLGEVF